MTKIAFIGAGSVVFTQGLLADLFSFEDLGELQIALHDIDPERLSTATGAANAIADTLGVSPRISAHLDRRAALDGCDFVINMIQVGMNEATRLDFEIPARYGVRQTIGDTLGAGGVFRALRTFPVLRGLAADIAAACPDAWLLNYTNPMAMNVWYLSALGVRNLVGLCHSVYWTMNDLSALVGAPYDEVSYLAAGVNHQAWVLRFEHQGRDLYPVLDDVIAGDPELARRVRVDMYRRLGHYPTETSEHSSEYVPWYLHDASEVERLRLPVGDYLRIVEENVALYQSTRDALKAGEALAVEGTMEYAPQVIHSMVTGTPRTIYGNVVNTGLISNLPANAVVEVPCLVDSLGVQPTSVGALPAQCAALNRAYINVNELVVKAALEDNPHAIRQALMVDPATSATLTVEQIWSLANDLVDAHSNYLHPSLRTRITL
ncbi:alpha-glucosidase/alpha-galactosidase [Kribbella sp. CA-294648]|uniref:alpha-glucosidase/alpha-galactosidase n=1 Tax=Kribbella sp. CA-294648 TaxID=3239948 RepID=UPI003D8FC3A2